MSASVAASTITPNDPGTTALLCPCGRSVALAECCLPIAEHLRRGSSGNPTPFDEIRASSSLLLWSLLATERPTTAVMRALSHAAHRFWGPILAGHYGPIGIGEQDDRPEAPQSTHDVWRLARGHEGDDNPFDALTGTAHTAEEDDDDQYGARLFDRIWGVIDPATLTWLRSSLPAYVLTDPVLGEIALDWLLWDAPWLRQRPAAHWAARTGALSRRNRVRRTTDAIIGSRVGLWRLDETVPPHGFRLTDHFTGDRTFLNTTSTPWPQPDERLLLARIYDFGDWHLLGGRCLLMEKEAVEDLLHDLATRARAVHAPTPRDPRWRAWLKAELLPLAAAQWCTARLAPDPPARYHGTYC